MRYVVEIKGINHDDFVLLSDDLQASMKLNKSIRTAVPQANLYMHLLELQKAIILVEDKSTQDFRLWVTDYDREAAQPYAQRADKVRGKLILYRANGGLPARICHAVSDMRAARCPMRTVCFEREEGDGEHHQSGRTTTPGR